MSSPSTAAETQSPTASAPKTRRTRRDAAPNLDDPALYFNRELSWLEFNRRVLEEAQSKENPLLERVKFLSIFSSNLDEFFMIRVSGLRRQLQTGVLNPPPDGMSPGEQLAALHETLTPMLDESARLWREELMPALASHDIHLLSYSQLKNKQRKLLRRHFRREIFPALTPLAFDPSHPFPHISNLSINLAVVVRHPELGERFARLKVPQIFPRLLRIPKEETADAYEDLGLQVAGSSSFVWLEEVVAANLDLLFPGLEVIDSYAFRVTRDADFDIEEDEASDLLEAMEEVVGQRHFGFAVRLEVENDCPDSIREILVRNLGMAPYQAFIMEGPIGKSDVMEVAKLDRPELKDPPFLPYTPPRLTSPDNLFSEISRQDQLVYHPYDSFQPVVDFIRTAATDPKVLTIKQTLYRVGPDSPVVKALMEARENGKQVAVLVELKARFDETNNIVWARALERAGVHVVYGVLGLKTHAKMSLVVRREKRGIKRYVHLGTGNYNPVTARIYTDLGFFTCDSNITADVSDLFNGLTGYSRKNTYRKILVAPRTMREELLGRISREIQKHQESGGGGHIVFKVNSLVDKACIQALYKASQAGVKVDLQIRGICCLRPGVAKVSEHISVTSLVGRFLEHTRIFYFRNGGEEEILAGSADIMPRNLDGRVEVLFPMDEPEILRAVRDDILFTHLKDTVNCRRLLPDGRFEKVKPEIGEKPLNTQATILGHLAPWRKS